jgi:hypothetical protein
MGRFHQTFYAGRRPPLDTVIYVAMGAKTAIAVGRSVVARRALV